MSTKVTIQNTITDSSVPNDENFKQWVTKVLNYKKLAAEVTIRIVNPQEIRQLNKRYRKQNKVTNVLAFPYEIPANINMQQPLLGDIVVCAEVVASEAKKQKKTLLAHWAHMVIHGLLHLLNYDHQTDSQAREMEALEIAILEELGFSNPYEVKS